MTFNKMRFPIVWITLALCVVLCAIEVHSGPVDQDFKLASKDYSRSARQEPINEETVEDDDDGSDEESGDEDGDGDDDGEEEEEERSLKRYVREASQKPLLVSEQLLDNEQQPDEDSVIPSTDTPSFVIQEVHTKNPSVLLMLSTALDTALSAAATKIPTQQIASGAANVLMLLGQVFSEALDNVIDDDGPEESVTEYAVTDATITETTPVEELTQLPIDHLPVKVEKQPEINSSSQSDMVIAASS